MSSNNASSMADLMAKYKSPFVSVKKGEIVKGVITKLTASEVLLDINGKTEAIVMEKDRNLLRAMLASLKVGDTVEAQVLNPESDTGNTVVSLRKFMDARVWEQLAKIQKESGKIDATVKGTTKGGYLVTTSYGIDGFLPNSHVSVKEDVQEMVGKSLKLMIAELNAQTRKLIVSQKPVLGQADFDSLAKTLKKGEKTDAIVSHITTFGLFVSIPVKAQKEETFLDGFIHISEIAWEKVTDLTTLFEVGQNVEAIVTSVDTKNKRIELSIKQLTEDPYVAAAKKYTADQKVTGNIEKITEQGIVVDIHEEGLEGFIRKEKVPPTTKYEVGQEVKLTVTDMDIKKHRIYLAPILLDKPLMYR